MTIHYHYCATHAVYWICQCPQGTYYAATTQPCPGCLREAAQAEG